MAKRNTHKSGHTFSNWFETKITKQQQGRESAPEAGLEGRTIRIVDVYHVDGKRFIVRAEEILTAFLELERAILEFAVDLIS